MVCLLVFKGFMAQVPERGIECHKGYKFTATLMKKWKINKWFIWNAYNMMWMYDTQSVTNTNSKMLKNGVKTLE